MSARPPGRTNTAVARGEARRAAIVAAATELFAEAGYHATTLSDVGARVGIKRPAVLHHFASKERLVHAVLDEHERRFNAVRIRIAQHRGLDALRQMIQVIEFQRDNPKRTVLWNMLLAESATPDAPMRERMLGNYNLFRFSVTFFLRQAEEDGELRPGVDFDREANALIAFFNGLETSWLLDPAVPIVDLARWFVDEMIARVQKPG
ncbi:TetR family transcriptional regulator [Conexibacter sp. JD483]|uniref:TetR family transcriptional regulator n=1 Tax=unclassified Conexibacter TaxID=2627773 RepID=UPI0027189829|nr:MULTISPECIES: TetR family transcriptional regulator [unclassified Conexibacter]MDO8186446.1 TetR family transcriptional regulator [Conexibacter sp. CPCC 205706]MDO8200015.1 TetR family transcriptional regulator [Conexibacter sp. CPCC 205762]MDR9370568.1 TetR family transcriptional regulator [Conexibacter sp. JD483]